ncbi:hypothetical protein BDN70DRAFT_916398 [Pholiota conissans]|uniref:F-box domain-containing protein n=1 Tax=Pholiota conissans TaxID=109636 RepID=A0A9P6D804_9AGAR|nr:hypothetical protein BDN70DRAFT_916398 [Pholiota conissans]
MTAVTSIMDPEPPRFFPSDIVNIIMTNLVGGKNYLTGADLTSLERRDLAACALVSSTFYLPSRRYFFSTMKIKLDVGSTTNTAGVLVEILTANPMLQELGRHLVVAYMDPTSGSPLMNRVGNGEIVNGDNLDHVIRLLPALRKLTIASSLPSRVSYFNQEALSPLRDLRALCPHIHSLILSNISGVSTEFIHHWKDVTDLCLDNVYFADKYRDGLDMAALLDHGVSNTPRLERLYIFGIMKCPPELRNAVLIRQLQHLHLEIHPQTVDLAVSDAVHLVNATSSSLNRLSLTRFANEEWLELISQSVFTKIKNLELIEKNPQKNPFPGIAIFLTPLNMNTISRMQILTISYTGPYYSIPSIFHPIFGWTDLDALWTGPQYAHLTRLNVQLTFTAAAALGEGEKRALTEHARSLLPLVTSTRRIALDFSVDFTHST